MAGSPYERSHGAVAFAYSRAMLKGMAARSGMVVLLWSLMFGAMASAQADEQFRTPPNRVDAGLSRIAPIADADALVGAWRVEGTSCLLHLAARAGDAAGAIQPSPECVAPWSDARAWRASRYALQIQDEAGVRLWAGLHTQDGRFRGRSAVLTQADAP